MELRKAFRKLGLSDEERRLLRTYTRNALRRGLTQACAVTVALHALDRFDENIGSVLGKKPKAVNHAVARARVRFDARGKGGIVRAIQVRPGTSDKKRRTRVLGPRPFERIGAADTSSPADRNSD